MRLSCSGMRQRAMIADGAVDRFKLLIADETLPTALMTPGAGH
jgi:ABC-type dipeptide/oligopeptide/nickel transport system ATPase component